MCTVLALVALSAPLRAAPSVRVGLVLDSSGSMATNDPKRIVPLAAALSLLSLQEGVSVAVADTGTAKEKGAPLVPPTVLTRERQRMVDDVLELSYRGQTHCDSALAQVMPFLTAREARDDLRYVLVLTDGQCNENPAGTQAKLRALRAAGVRVFLLGLGAEVDRAALGEMARASGGHVLDEQATPEDVPRYFGEIAGRALGSRAVPNRLTSGRQAMPADRYVRTLTALFVSDRGPIRIEDVVGPDGARSAVVLSRFDNRKGLHGAVLRIPRPSEGEWTYRLKGTRRASVAVIQDSALHLTLTATPSSVVLGDATRLEAVVQAADGGSPAAEYLRDATIELFARGPADTEPRTLGAMTLSDDGRFRAELRPDREGDWVYEALLQRGAFLRRESPLVRVSATIGLTLKADGPPCPAPGDTVRFVARPSRDPRYRPTEALLQRLVVRLEAQRPGESDFTPLVPKMAWVEDHFEHELPLTPRGTHHVRAVAELHGSEVRSNALRRDAYQPDLRCRVTRAAPVLAAGGERLVTVECAAPELSHEAALTARFDGAPPDGVEATLEGPEKIAPGETARFTLRLRADEDVPDGGLAGTVVVQQEPLCATLPPLERTERLTVALVGLDWQQRALRWIERHLRWLLVAVGLLLFLMWLYRRMRAHAFAPAAQLSLYASVEDMRSDTTYPKALANLPGAGKGFLGRNAQVTITDGFDVLGGRADGAVATVEAGPAGQVLLRAGSGIREVRFDGATPVTECPTSVSAVSGVPYEVVDRMVLVFEGL